MGSRVYPLGYGNKSARIDHVPYPWDDSGSCSSKLGEGGGWVVSVTMWVLGAIEGRTLVSGQRNTILDAQWQVRLGLKESEDSVYHRSMKGKKPTLEM